jgi:hypothetical protein
MDELIGILEERLRPIGVQIERQEAWFGGRWTRPQFSLRSLLVLTTVVAIILGLVMCLKPEARNPLLTLLVCQVILAAPPLLALVPWRRPGKIFAAGYVIGVIVEFRGAVGLLEGQGVAPWAPATGASEGWYPLSVLIERLAAAAGWSDHVGAFMWPWSGCFVSGLLGGTALLAAWYLIAWPLGRLRRALTTSH